LQTVNQNNIPEFYIELKNINFTLEFNQKLVELNRYNPILPSLLKIHLLILDKTGFKHLKEDQMKSIGVLSGTTNQTRGLYKINFGVGKKRYEVIYCMPEYCRNLVKKGKGSIKRNFCKQTNKMLVMLDIGEYGEVNFSDYSSMY